MAKYKVLMSFTEPNDRAYYQGDLFPGTGSPTASEDRIAYLLNQGDRPNRFNRPLLERVEAPKPLDDSVKPKGRKRKKEIAEE